jgi:hypothetical protein
MDRRPQRHLALVLVVGTIVMASRLILEAIPTQQVGTWASIGTMAESRTRAASVALPDGRTVIVGGTLADGTSTGSIVILNPADNSVTPAGALSASRTGHTATPLKDGRLLVAGGTSNGVIVSDIDIVDLVAGTVTSSGLFLTQPRSGHAAARLTSGEVLIAGGSTVGSGTLASAELIDMTAATVNLTTVPMATARSGATATTMIDGRVLVAGGNDGTQDLASAEIFFALDQSFSAAGTSLSQARSGHTALLLPDNGAVLIAGGTIAGEPGQPRVPVTTSDWFQPAMFPDPYSWGEGAFAATAPLAQARANAMTGPYGEGHAFVSGGGSTAAEQFHFATIKTNKDDYPPGEFALITGSGWQPGEEVTLVFQEDPAVHADYVLTITADDNGNFSYNSWAPEQHDLNVRFYLMATGVLSQSRAQVTFTDGNLQAVTLAPTSVTVAQGATAAYVANVQVGGNNDQCTVTLGVTTVLPAGAVASFSGGDNPFTTNASFSRNLSISTTAGTPPGTYPFTLQATRDANCQGNGNLTTPGALVVTSAVQDQTINLTTAAPMSAAYGSTFNVAATATSGLPVTIASSGACSGGDTDGTATITMTAGTGTCTVSYNQAGNASFNPAPQVQNTTTASKATLTVTASNHSVTYGDAVPAITRTYAGFLPGDDDEVLFEVPTCSTTYTTTSGVATSPATTSCSGGSDEDYSYSFVAGSVTIGQASSTTTVMCTAGPHIYTSFAIEPCSVEVTGAGGLSLTPPPTYSNNVEGPGPATASYTFDGDANHTGSSDSETFMIDPAPTTTTVTCGVGPFTYNGSAHTPCSATVTGPGLSQSRPVSYSNNVNAGTAQAGASFVGNANYLDSNDSENFTIGQATLTVTASSASVTYGDAVPTITPIYGTFVGSDDAGDLDTAPTCSTVYTTSSNAGSSPATSCSGGSAVNYAFSFVAGSVTVGQATLTVTASSPSVSYGDAVPTITPIYGTFVGSDDAGDLDTGPTCSTVYTTSSNAGSSPATSCSGGSDNNYAFSFVAGSVTVGQATLTVTASSPSVTYGDPVPTITPIYGTFVGSDDAGDLDTAPTCSTVYTTSSNAGSSPATSCSGGSDVNYTFSFVAGSVTIGQASSTVTVTCTAGAPYIYTGSPQTPCTAQATGVGMSPVNVISSLIYSNNTNAGPATADASWDGDTNHTGDTGSGGFTIGKATLTVTATSASVTYGDPVPTITPIYGTFLGSDNAAGIDSAPTCSTAYTTSSLAGSNPPTSCSGGLDNNYNFSFVPGSVTVGTAFCTSAFLSPIGGSFETGNGGSFADPVRAFKLGSTIPVKFLLNSVASGCGAVVTTGIHTLQASRYSNSTDSDPAIDASPTDAATAGHQFRLTGTEWHFNLSTKGGGFTQGTWLLTATLQDGSKKTVWITIKK